MLPQTKAVVAIIIPAADLIRLPCPGQGGERIFLEHFGREGLTETYTRLGTSKKVTSGS